MTPQTTGWDELHLSENPAVVLLESLHYTYVPPEQLEGERTSFKEAILTGRLAAALKRLNPWLSQTNLAKAVKAVTQVPAASLAEANERVYTSLTYGIALEQDLGGGRKSHTVRFLDFDRPEGNEWVVTRQYKVLGSKKHIIPDVVAFVNGLPLAVIECKSPTIGDAWKSEAVKQVHRYQETGNPLEGPGSAEAVRGGADPGGKLRGTRRLRHGRHTRTVFPRMEATLSPDRGGACQETGAHALAAGHPALRAP